MTLRDCINRHRGETAWLFAKGPGLDAMRGRQFEGVGALRACINESVLVVPYPTYFFAADGAPIDRVGPHFPVHATAVLWEKDLGKFRKHVPAGRSSYAIAHNGYYDGTPPDHVQCAVDNKLWKPTGTLQPALHFLAICGVTRVVMVGFDGIGGYAECIQALGLPNSTRDYTFILDAAKEQAKVLALELEWWKP